MRVLIRLVLVAATQALAVVCIVILSGELAGLRQVFFVLTAVAAQGVVATYVGWTLGFLRGQEVERCGPHQEVSVTIGELLSGPDPEPKSPGQLWYETNARRESNPTNPTDRVS